MVCNNLSFREIDPGVLEHKMGFQAISFARKGDPSHAGLPKWPAFTAEKGATMIFDKNCEAKNDPDREERRAVME